MSVLISIFPCGARVARTLPEGAFQPAAAPGPRPDLARLNAGQGDARGGIVPNVRWPDAPPVTSDGVRAFVRLDDWLARGVAPGAALVLMPGDDPLRLAGHLEGLDLIAVSFLRFTDGRGLSQAALLRGRLGWSGPLRAVGDVLSDQATMLARVGFDELALREGQDPAVAIRAVGLFASVYQHAADGRGPGAPAGDARAAA